MAGRSSDPRTKAELLALIEKLQEEPARLLQVNAALRQENRRIEMALSRILERAKHMREDAREAVAEEQVELHDALADLTCSACGGEHARIPDTDLCLYHGKYIAPEDAPDDGGLRALTAITDVVEKYSELVETYEDLKATHENCATAIDERVADLESDREQMLRALGMTENEWALDGPTRALRADAEQLRLYGHRATPTAPPATKKRARRPNYELPPL